MRMEDPMNAVAVKVIGGRSDVDLDRLARKAKNDPEAAKALMNHRIYRPAVQRQCRDICRVSQWVDSDDLEQQFFEDFEQSIRTFEGKSSLLTWTKTVLRNLYFDHIRRERVGEQKV